MEKFIMKDAKEMKTLMELEYLKDDSSQEAE